MTVQIGDLLLAEPFLKDPNFKRSVVLMCEHNDKGSFGLVLNRKLDLHVDDVMPEFPVEGIELYYGGPVGTDTLHYIHTYGDLLEGSIPVKDDICWSGNFEQVKIMFETQSVDPARFRFFIGYSGWSEGQLQAEMDINSWIIARNFNNILMPDDELWSSILQHMGGEYKIVSSFPEDPQLN